MQGAPIPTGARAPCRAAIPQRLHRYGWHRCGHARLKGFTLSTFTPIPWDLYRHAEPEAGTILPALTGRWKAARPHEQFDPDWTYLLSGNASTIAVIAGLHCGSTDVPDHAWAHVLRLCCPAAATLLTAAGVTVEQWRVGRCPAPLGGEVAATANAELGGYQVFPVMDAAAVTAQVIAALGQVPRFEHP